MDRVTLRIPASVVRAYDDADGNRSELMRRRLTQAVADGEVSGVAPDLRQLADIESAVSQGELTRRRGTFKSRVHSFFAEKWDNGAVTAQDADDMATTWLDEAAVHGPEQVAYVQAVLDWYRENYTADPTAKPEFPPADYFVRESDPADADPDEALTSVAANALDAGADPDNVVERLSSRHGLQAAEQAVSAARESAE